VRSLKQVPRQPIVYNATNNALFFAALNNYVLKVCKEQQHYHGLLSFWSGVATEAVAGMLELAQSGRRELQQQNEEEVLLKILPMLDDALQLQKALELRLGCYMVIIVLANKASLGDKIIDRLMESVLEGWSSDSVNAALVCLSILAERKQVRRLPRKVVIAVGRVDYLDNIVLELSQKYNMTPFLQSLINGVLRRVESGKGLSQLELVERLLLRDGLLHSHDAKVALLSIIRTVQNLPKNETHFLDFRNSYSDMLQRLNESRIGPTLQKLIKDEKVNISGLELALQTVLAIDESKEVDEMGDVKMTEDVEENSEEIFNSALSHVPERTVDETSLLATSKSHVYGSLEKAFITVAKSPQAASKFRNLPLLRQDEESGSILFWSFFVRILCSSHSAQVRTAAIRLAVTEVSGAKSFQELLQMIFPYVICTLADPSDIVRNRACQLIVALTHHYDNYLENETTLSSESFNAFYGATDNEQHSMSAADMSKLLKTVFVPFLEEFSLDLNRAGLTLERALRGSSTSNYPQAKASVIDLKKSIRHDFFLFLKCHIVSTPIYGVKLRLLDMIKSVEKVGSTSCSKEFLPLLKQWASHPESEVSEVSTREGIKVPELESQMSVIISPNDRETLSYWLSIMKDPASTSRASFRRALFERIQAIWPLMKIDRQLAASDFLLEGALDPQSEGSSSCREVLHTIPLHSDVLVHLVDKVQQSIANLPERPSPAKRRRTSKSDSSSSRVNVYQEFVPLIQKMTFIFELIDSSKPESHPALFGKLFDALSILQHFKSQVQSELAYVQNLLLSSLLAMVKKSRTSPSVRLDTSAIRADLIVDCIRHTQSHQVQNTALLLVANLAKIAPDLTLHSVMPIFTFLGGNILKQTDEYSTYVIDQTVDEVIPALVQSLRDQKRNVVTGTSELLQSFTAAFDHIPSHRRLRLFKALVSKLGPDEFLFAVLAILAEKYQSNAQVKSFAVNLASEFEHKVQLNSLKQILGLIEDSLQEKPAQAQTLLGVGRDGGRDRSSIAVDQFKMIAHLLRGKSLTAKVNKDLNADTTETTLVRSALSELAEQTLDLSETLKGNKQALAACNDVLGSLLSVLSITELIKTTTHLLMRDDDDFRRKILKLLEARLRVSSSNATSIYKAALEFLLTLTDIVETSAIPSLKQAAVACIDQICEKYGKKDTGKVVKAAKVIAGVHCLGQSDERTQVISALCLASVIEVLGEAIVPVLPETIPRALKLLEISIQEDAEKPKLHNAVYSLFSALLAHLPWMISGFHLNELLRLSFESAITEMGDDCDAARKDVLQLVAKKVEFKQCLMAIEVTWSDAVTEGPVAVIEVLSALTTAIEKAPKSAIVTNSSKLRDVFFKVFGLRCTQFSEPADDSYDEDEVAQIETLVNDVAIKMIYKMNDTTFRPLFVSLVEWATTGLPKKDKTGRTLRLTTFYNFLSTFFETLKVRSSHPTPPTFHPTKAQLL
jgi:U3 small nucleolar RNA-associated protein 10